MALYVVVLRTWVCHFKSQYLISPICEVCYGNNMRNKSECALKTIYNIFSIMKIVGNTITVDFNTILPMVLFFYSAIFCPVLWGEIKLLSFLTQTWWMFSLIYLYCSNCTEDGHNSSSDNMKITGWKINFEWKPSFISMQTSKFKRLRHKELVNILLKKCYFWYSNRNGPLLILQLV